MVTSPLTNVESGKSLHGSVYFQTTQKRLNITRFHQLISSFLDQNNISAPISQIEAKFSVEHCANVDETVNLLTRELTEERPPEEKLKMVIIDGVHQLELETRQWNGKKRKLFELGTTLRKLAKTGIACVVSNSFNRSFAQKRVKSGFDEQNLVPRNSFEKMKPKTKDRVTMNFNGKTWKKKFVYFGDFWSWAAQERFQLDRIEGLQGKSKRLFQVWFSRSFVEKRLWFKIENCGLVFSQVESKNGEEESGEEEEKVETNEPRETGEKTGKLSQEKAQKNEILQRIFGEKRDFSKWNG